MAYKQQQLLRFCATGNIKEVKRLIYENVSLDAIDEKGNNCVHQAVRSNQHKVLQLLIENAADLNAVNNAGYSPLHAAVYSGAECCVSVLLKEGIRVNQFNKEGLTELMLAVQIRDNLDPPHQVGIIKQLLNHDEIDLRAISRDRQRQTALHYAAFCGNVFAVKRLLHKDASLHQIPNAYNNLAIHLAASSRFNDVIKAIYHKVPNLDINAKGHKCRTPLQMAMKFGHFSTIELLVNLRADVTTVDNEGNSILHLAVEAFKDCCTGTKRLNCFQKGYDSKEIKRIRESLSTTLQINCANLAVVLFLIEKGYANIYTMNNRDQSPLDLVSHEKRVVNVMKTVHHSNEGMESKRTAMSNEEYDYEDDYDDDNDDEYYSSDEKTFDAALHSVENRESNANNLNSLFKDDENLKTEVRHLTKRVGELESIVESLKSELKQMKEERTNEIAANNHNNETSSCFKCIRTAEYSLLCGHKLCDKCYEENNCLCIMCQEN